MVKWHNKKVGVLMGGVSKEREISLRTGKAVFEALKRRGCQTVAIDCGLNLVEQLKKDPIDVAFIALHGAYGEDGCVQGLLEWLQIPYTGSGVLASALAMDKAVLNSLSRDLGFLVPKEIIFDERFETIDSFVTRFNPQSAIRNPQFPVIVKPSREGSTINVTIVKESQKLLPAINQALQSDCKVLVEEYIQGKEVTISLLNGKALPSIEIAPKKGFYDYQSKYTKGMTDYILPARVSQRCIEELNRISERLFRAIDCGGVARADFIVSGEGPASAPSELSPRREPSAEPGRRGKEKPYFLEINTIPGMTETSLVPKAAAHAGISFEDLCEQILEGAGLKVVRSCVRTSCDRAWNRH